MKQHIISLGFLLFISFGFFTITAKAYATFTISDVDTSELRKQPDISCLIIDFKYDEDSLKILEMGNIALSSVAKYDSLYGKGAIWNQLWNYLAQHSLPVWYVGGLVTADKNDMAFDTFFKKGWKYLRDIRSLSQDPTFHSHAKSKTFMPEATNIENYTGIIVGDFSKKVKKYNRLFPGFILLNDAVFEYANNKHKLASLFTGDLKKFKPICKSYPKAYSDQLIDQIDNDFPCDTIVIKPINSTRGQGIIMLQKKDLDKTLRKIFLEKKDLKNNKDTPYTYWTKDHNDIFLVESLEQSKHITIDNKKHDPTARIICILEYNNQEQIKLTFLGGYWKFPKKSIEQEGTLTEKHKSYVLRRKNIYAKPINEKDSTYMQNLFLQVLPELYKKMLIRNKSLETV